MTFITRFAPSPTGNLHIGGVRTALINYIAAQKHKGKFLLRIEDTDQERSTEQAKNAILNGLKILGLKHDGEVIYQSNRKERHQEAALSLIDTGSAYYCFTSKEEIEAFRKDNPHTPFPSKYRDIGRTPKAREQYTVRLKVARHEEFMEVQDLLAGSVKVPVKELDDMILLRSDGTPTYMLAVVVDDHDMGVTYVIRGNDHFTNTFRQKALYQAFNWKCPEFCHIPLIHGEDGAKLSKRHGATSIEEFIAQGYLPQAIINYLLLLGAGFDEQEIFDIEYAIANFDEKRLSKSPSRFDYKKLDFINSKHLRLMDDENLSKMICDYLNINNIMQDRITKAIPLIKERSITILDAYEIAKLFIEKPIIPDEKSKEILKKYAFSFWEEIITALDTITENSWNNISIEKTLKAFAENSNYKYTDLLQALRAKIFATFTSPGIIGSMSILGKKECLERIIKD